MWLILRTTPKSQVCSMSCNSEPWVLVKGNKGIWWHPFHLYPEAIQLVNKFYTLENVDAPCFQVRDGLSGHLVQSGIMLLPPSYRRCPSDRRHWGLFGLRRWDWCPMGMLLFHWLAVTGVSPPGLPRHHSSWLSGSSTDPKSSPSSRSRASAFNSASYCYCCCCYYCPQSCILALTCSHASELPIIFHLFKAASTHGARCWHLNGLSRGSVWWP